MISDVYNHILPKRYQDTLEKKVTGRNQNLPSANWTRTIPTLMDLDARFRIMDAFDGRVQSPHLYPSAGGNVESGL